MGLFDVVADIDVTSGVGIPFWGDLNLKLLGNFTGFINPPSEWDVVRYGPSYQPLPGLAKVKRCSRRMKLHRKEHPASDFETQTFQGWSVVEFDFELLLWTKPQLINLQNALAYLFPGAGDPPNPVSSISVTTLSSTQNIVNPNLNTSSGATASQMVQMAPNTPKRAPIPVKVRHPALQLHGVDALVFETMDGPLQLSESVPDIFVVRFKTVQYKPSVPVQHKTLNQTSTLQTPLGANPGPGIAPAQAPNLGPAQSGGADPFGANQYANYVYTPPGQGPLLP